MNIPKIVISPAEWAIVRDILQRHVPGREVWAFGSRAKWTSKEFSDLDLAIIGDEPLSITILASLSEDFSESELPYKVDIVDWATTSASFRSVIERDKVAIQQTADSAWPYVRLGDHCDKIGSGATPKGGKEAYLTAGPYRLIRSQNIHNDGFKYDGLAYISDEQAKKLDGVAVNANDVLLNITGDSVARVCSAPSNVLPARVNQHVAIIRPSPSSFDTHFVRYYLTGPQQQDLLLGLASAGATRNALTKGMIESLQIPQPPMRTQRSIAETLAALDDKITLLRETNATLEAIAQALFKSWFVDFDPVRAKAEGCEPEGMDVATAELFPDSFEESKLGLVPRGWRASTMDEVSVVGIGKTPPRKEPQWFSENANDVRWVSIRDMGISGAFISQTSEYLTAESIKRFNVRQVPDNTVLLSFKMTIGRVALTDGEMTTNEAIAHFKLDEPSLLTSEFIYLHLKQFDYSRLSSTSSIADAVNSKTVKAIPILAPDAAVVLAFQDAIHPVFKRIRLVQQQAQTLSILRDTLLPRLMSGKQRLTDSESIEEAA